MAKVDLLRSRKLPFEAVMTRKAGSKFLMNLFFYIDHGELYEFPHAIESCQDLKWVQPTPSFDLDAVRLTVFRNPTKRFVDFYWENIYCDAPNQWKHWRQDLYGLGFDYQETRDPKVHQHNAIILLEFIADKMENTGRFDVAKLYAPQVSTVLIAQDLGFRPVAYSRLNIELQTSLGKRLPELDGVLKAIDAQLHIPTPIPRTEILHPQLVNRLRALYGIDFDFFEAMQYGTT